MKIKQEHIDTYVSSPLNGKTVWLRELDPELYNYFKGNGYEYIFEEDKMVTIKSNEFFTCKVCGERLEECECNENKKKSK
jgi:phosphoketolase